MTLCENQNFVQYENKGENKNFKIIKKILQNQKRSEINFTKNYLYLLGYSPAHDKKNPVSENNVFTQYIYINMFFY